MVRPWVIVLLLAIVVLGYLGWRFIEARLALRFERWKEAHSRSISRGAIQSGAGTLNGNERKVRRAVHDQKVEWMLFRIPDHQASIPAIDTSD